VVLLTTPLLYPYSVLLLVMFLVGIAYRVEAAGQGAAGVGIGITVSLMYAGTTATAPLFGYVADLTGSYTLSWGLMLWLLLGIGCLAVMQTAPVGAAAPCEACLPTGGWRGCTRESVLPRRWRKNTFVCPEPQVCVFSS
jgi:hypothetical protein